MNLVNLNDLINPYQPIIDQWGLHGFALKHVYELDDFVSIRILPSTLSIWDNFIKDNEHSPFAVVVEFGPMDGLHREDGPAVLCFHAETHLPISTAHFNNGRMGRQNGPCREEFDPIGRHVFFYNWNEQGRLHCEDGPAQLIHGNFEYWLNGIQVPSKVVMDPQLITLKEIQQQQNIEVQRLMIEKFGWLKFAQETKSAIIDSATDAITGTKELLIDLKDTGLNQREWRKGLICSCPSTGKVFCVEVPFATKYCRDAQQWLKGNRMSKTRMIGAS